MLSTATEAFYRHYFVGLFPKASAPKTDDPETLRRQALTRLRRAWGQDAELKESFKAEDGQVHFALRLKTAHRQWLTLLETEGTRLQTTRLAAYRQVLEQLSAGGYGTGNGVASAAFQQPQREASSSVV